MIIQITSSSKTFHKWRADTTTKWSPEVNSPPIIPPVTLYMENGMFFDFWEVVEIPLRFQHTSSYSSIAPSWKKSNQVSSVHCIPGFPFPKVNRNVGKIQGTANQSFIILCISCPADSALQHFEEIIRMKAQTTGPLKPQIYFSYHQQIQCVSEVIHGYHTQFALVLKPVLCI